MNNKIQENYCSIHPDFKIDLIQVSGFQNNKANQSLFYCLECIENDPDFNSNNYLILQKLFKSELKNINLKWPPLDNPTILNKLNEIIIKDKDKNNNNNDNNFTIVQEVESFFINFKQQIMEEVNKFQKEMIEKAKQYENKKRQIIDIYSSISNIQELKCIFTNQNISIDEKQQQYKKLVQDIQQSKNSIIQQLKEIQTLLDTQYQIGSLQSLQTIIDNDKQINLFQSTITSKNQIENKDINKNNNIYTMDYTQNQSVVISQIKSQLQNNNINKNMQITDNIQNKSEVISEIKSEIQNNNNNNNNTTLNNYANYLINSFILTYRSRGWLINSSKEEIKKDDENKITLQKNSPNYESTQFLSDYVIDPSQKYVFKIKLIPTKLNDTCRIYLSYIKDDCSPGLRYSFIQLEQKQRDEYEKKKGTYISIDYLSDPNNCSEFRSKKDSKFYRTPYFELTEENIIEFRVSLNEGIYDFLDYPDYRYHIQISSDSTDFLKKPHQRLGFTIPEASQMKLILMDAFIATSF